MARGLFIYLPEEVPGSVRLGSGCWSCLGAGLGVLRARSAGAGACACVSAGRAGGRGLLGAAGRAGWLDGDVRSVSSGRGRVDVPVAAAPLASFRFSSAFCSLARCFCQANLLRLFKDNASVTVCACSSDSERPRATVGLRPAAGLLDTGKVLVKLYSLAACQSTRGRVRGEPEMAVPAARQPDWAATRVDSGH
jgi:hypothetical protein